MDKDKAIQILTELKTKINQDNLILDDWKRDACADIARIFVSSFVEKQKDVKAISPVWSSILQPRNEEQKKQQKEEQDENLRAAKQRLVNLIDRYIKEINESIVEINENEIIKSLENQLSKANESIESLKTKNEELEKKISKTLWDRCKYDMAFWAIIVSSVLVLISATAGATYMVVDRVVSNEYDNKFKIEKDSLTKQNANLILQIKQLKVSFDSLKTTRVPFYYKPLGTSYW